MTSTKNHQQTTLGTVVIFVSGAEHVRALWPLLPHFLQTTQRFVVPSNALRIRLTRGRPLPLRTAGGRSPSSRSWDMTTGTTHPAYTARSASTHLSPATRVRGSVKSDISAAARWRHGSFVSCGKPHVQLMFAVLTTRMQFGVDLLCTSNSCSEFRVTLRYLPSSIDVVRTAATRLGKEFGGISAYFLRRRKKSPFTLRTKHAKSCVKGDCTRPRTMSL